MIWRRGSRRVALAVFTPMLAALLTACGPDTGRENFVQYPTKARNFHYEVFLPEAADSAPLVLFSHGSGGDYRNYSWLIEELVSAGFAVATLNHPSNTARDNSDEGVVRVWDRPRDISLLLDALEADPRWSKKVDFNRIGVAGHSSGGYTAIALGGARFDHQAMAAYCTGASRGPDCNLASAEVVVDFAGASDSYRDTRIRSILAMAPAVGPGIEATSLESFDVPVYIIATRDDELLGLDDHAAYYARHIPRSELSLLPEGGHFVFIECDIPTTVADWFIEELDLCGADSGADRDQIRREIAQQVVAFFANSIGTRQGKQASKEAAGASQVAGDSGL